MIHPKGREATRAALERSALDLALEHGYDEVTVDMICQAAGISQRTFFNYFPTKDDALLGSNMPSVDEPAARRFVLSDGPLLLDALALISLPATHPGERSMDERMRVIASSPALMAKMMERIGAVEAEMQEIIGLRLEHTHPERSEEERVAESTMITHLIAGLMRFMGTSSRGGGAELSEVIQRTRAILAQVLADSPVDPSE